MNDRINVVDHRIKTGRIRWKMTLGVLRDKRKTTSLKEKWYITVV